MSNDFQDLELIPGVKAECVFKTKEEERAYQESFRRQISISYAIYYVKFGRHSDYRLISSMNLQCSADWARKIYLKMHPEEVERMQKIEESRRKDIEAISRRLGPRFKALA